MKRISLVAVLALASITMLSACHGKRLRGKGNKITTSIPVTAFSALTQEVSIKTIITIQPGAQPSLQLKGYENILPHIKTSQENNQLRIYSDLENSWALDKHDETTAELTLPSLAMLHIAGASDVDIHGNMTGDAFKMQISGSGNLEIDNLNVNEFSSDISGAGNLDIKGGNVQKADFEINGAGKISSFPLQAADVVISVSGAAKADITANKTLAVNISGAGKIKYKGHPTLSKDISGAGSIRDVN